MRRMTTGRLPRAKPVETILLCPSEGVPKVPVRQVPKMQHLCDSIDAFSGETR